MILPIKKEGDPVLREPTEQVVDFDFEFQTLVNNMIETMRANNGVGLAAPQVGVSKRILVCEFTAEEDSQLPSFPLTVLCNPRIKQASKEEVNMVEGCLSVPDREILVKRPKSVTVVAQDRYGNPIEIDAESIFARVVQHEIDHLNSTLIVDHVQELNVMFIGTGSLGEYSLRELIADTQYHVNAVITGEAKATIRGQAVETNTIAQIAHQAKIPLIRTERIRDEAIIEKIKKINPDLIVMADFGQIIPKEILNIPRFGVLNIHPSLLPRHRGPSPIQQTILDGDKMAGVSLMLTVPELDAGPVIAQTAVELIGVETSSILKDYLGELGAALLLNSLPYYLAGDLKPVPQNHEKATFTRMFTKEDGQVDSSTPGEIVYRKIRAFDAWPKVYTTVNGKRIQLLSAHLDENGRLVIDLVKPEGKKEMTYQDFKNGYRTELTFLP